MNVPGKKMFWFKMMLLFGIPAVVLGFWMVGRGCPLPQNLVHVWAILTIVGSISMLTVVRKHLQGG